MSKVLSKINLSLPRQIQMNWLNPAIFRVKGAPERPKSFFIQAFGEEDRIDGFTVHAVNLNSLPDLNPGIFRAGLVEVLEEGFHGQTCPDPDVECEGAIWVYSWDLESLLTNSGIWD